jgi:glycosyltransferase involved in cell wall biosynthesis
MSRRRRVDEIALAKVSIIIVNYNYGRFLHKAFESASKQLYPNKEIIFVDDCSTDDSRDVIDAIVAEHKNVSAIKLDRNVGQSAASLHGFNASSGAYVLFMDADDELLQDCVEAHVYAHLSSRIAVALTSVDIVNGVGGQDVNLSHAGFAGYVEAGAGRRPAAVRCARKSLPGSWFGCRDPAVEPDQLHFVMPPHADPWVWSPTSANCYRRDAVRLLLRDPGMETLRWGTDTYLARPLSALFGSILIDRPLTRYVSHDGNYFLKGAPLNNTLFFDTEPETADTIAVTRFAVKRLMAEVGQPHFLYADSLTFFDAMRALCKSWPGVPPESGGESFFVEQLRANRASLSATFGADTVNYELKRP